MVEMFKMLMFILLYGYIALVPGQLITNETLAQTFVDQYTVLAEDVYSTMMMARWQYNTNLTTENQHKSIAEDLKVAQFEKDIRANASKYAFSDFADQTLKRIFQKLSDIGVAALQDEVKLERLSTVRAEMEHTYSNAKVMIAGQSLSFDPDLAQLMATSRDYNTLAEVWKGWRDATGKHMKENYEEMVSLSNEAIRVNGNTDTGAYWRSNYEVADLPADMEGLYSQLEPLYKNLHIYVRRKLRAVYGAEQFPDSGHIPAHLLGNMWAQQWTNIADIVMPFEAESLDVTAEMVNQNYTVLQMFELAEEFFTSLGLLPTPASFWTDTMFVKPADGRPVVCYASAWDFFNRQDFRIKQCTEITQSWLRTTHHEMGHIQYFLQYKDQNIKFRDGANPGFHEAIGDLMALSVSTPKHLHAIGLGPNNTESHEATINFLMSMALGKIAFLPFGYLMDLWRWSVFDGTTQPDQYNEKWWQLRCKYQGLSTPDSEFRGGPEYFDPGAKFHIPANVPYIRYFVSFVIQFQFHKALCDAAGHTGDLYSCDIYKSHAAGAKLSNVMRLGSSVSWQDAMEAITGQREMDASPLMEYFATLTQWLTQQNQDAGDTEGWREECPVHTTVQPSTTTEASKGHGLYAGYPRVFVILLVIVVMQL